MYCFTCFNTFSYFTKFFVTMAMPIAGIAIIVIVGKAGGQKRGDVIGQVCAVLFFLYPSMSAKTFEMFDCRNIGEASVHSLDYTIDCRSVEYSFMVIFALCMVGVYPVGIPAYFAWLTLREKSQLDIDVNEEATKFRHGTGEWEPTDGQEEMLAKALHTQDEMEFLVGSYEPRIFWWELVEYARKFLLTGALMFAERETVSQVFIGLIISFFYFALVTTKGPYAEDLADRLKMGSEMQLFVTLLCSLCLMPMVSMDGEWISKTAIDYILVVVNAVAMPSFMTWLVLAQLRAPMKSMIEINKMRLVGTEIMDERAREAGAAGSEIEMDETFVNPRSGESDSFPEVEDNAL